MRTVAWLALFGFALTSAAEAGQLLQGGRVRATSDASRRIIDLAIEASPSIAAAIADLDRTDVIVMVETRRLPRKLRGFVQVAVATASVRYLRLVLGVPDSDRALVAVLGHELQHALEIAGMPEVRDGATLAAAYRRRGARTLKNGFYETDRALEAGRLVAREVERPHQ